MQTVGSTDMVGATARSPRSRKSLTGPQEARPKIVWGKTGKTEKKRLRDKPSFLKDEGYKSSRIKPLLQVLHKKTGGGNFFFFPQVRVGGF